MLYHLRQNTHCRTTHRRRNRDLDSTKMASKDSLDVGSDVGVLHSPEEQSQQIHCRLAKLIRGLH